MKTSKFTQAQRDEAVSLFLKDKSKKDKICKKFKIAERTLRKWVQDYLKSQNFLEHQKVFNLRDIHSNNPLQINLKTTKLWPKESIDDFIKEQEQMSDFDKTIDFRLMKTRELLLVKGKEYVRGDDRFHNFNRAAEMNRQTPTRALHGMLTKHLVSMLDILDDIDAGKLPSKETIDEKFGDVVVYVLLQEALIKHKFTKEF